MTFGDCDAFELDSTGWRFHSGAAIYTERFANGRLLGASLQHTGVPWYAYNEAQGQPSFDLVIDGDSCQFDWELVKATRTAEGPPTIELVLRHARKPVELHVQTQACGEGLFRRRMSLKNTSAADVIGLTSVSPLCGLVWAMGDLGREIPANAFRLGWMEEVEWGQEGKFAWRDLPRNAEVAIGSCRGRSGFTTPWAILNNTLMGGYMVLGLSWSASWRMAFAFDHLGFNQRGQLRFTVSPSGFAPQRLIEPGESLAMPEVHFGLNSQGFDETVQAWHGYLRRCVLTPVTARRPQPVIYNHWGFMEHEMSEPGLMREVDIAADIGAEMFIVDAGWYADKGTPWPDTSGDWLCGDRLPRDLNPAFDYARQRGLACGLWCEVESAGKASKLAKEHPDWFVHRYGQTVQRVLDLARPEVAQYVEQTVTRLVEQYKLELFRLDYNIDAWEGGFNLCHGRQENTLWRHVEAMYGIFDRLRRRFPSLQLENCSSGGGRTDLGMVGRFTTTWISDWMRMPRTVRIFNGMSMALPPEYLDRLFGVCMQGSYQGDLDAQMQLVILAHPTFSGLTPVLAQANPTLMAKVRKYIAIYKDFIRPMHGGGRIYHHTPELPGVNGSGWCAIEQASEDRRRAVACVLRLTDAQADEYRLVFRGLDGGRRYRLTLEPQGLTAQADGADLMQQGWIIRRDTALTSQLILAQAM